MEILQYVITVLMVVFIESLLSVDNSVIISMVANKAEPKDRNKVIRYGIIGAFVFRGLSLFMVSWIMTNPEFGGIAKLIGGLYLMKLGYEIITPKIDSIEEGEEIGWLESLLKWLKIPAFIGLVINLEILDLVMSIDNLFSAIAFTENIKGEYNGIKISLILTILGVFLGIIVMRWVTVRVMKLIEKYPSLEKSAGIVIVLLGFKLLISSILTLLEKESLTFFKSIVLKLSEYSDVIRPVLENHYTDFVFSAIMMGIFAYPVIFKKK
jgi:YkoY family integral membrane protein